MAKYQLITVDVWDTLIRRKCHPDAVKAQVCLFLLNNFHHIIKAEYCDIWQLLRERQAAEGRIGAAASATGWDDEYQLKDVYRSWLECVLIDSTSLDSILEQLESFELAQEKHVIYVDPTIRKLLSAHSAPARVFVSDFYMPSSHLMELLRHVGLDDIINRGYSSCDHQLNKRSGRLFEFVHKAESVNAAGTLHIGDNLHSDVTIPKGLGAKAIAYRPAPESILQKRKHRFFEDRKVGIQKMLTECADEIKPPQELSRPEKTLFRYGAHCAPLFVGLILFIMEQCLRKKHSKVYFFTREGEFFKEIYDTLSAANPFGHAAPPSELLEVSRLSTFAPSLQEISTSELMRIWNLYGTQSIAAMLKSLNVDVSKAAQHLQRHNLDSSEAIRYPWLDQRIVELLNDEEFNTFLCTEIAKNKNTLLSYLKQKGLDAAASKAAIVDIGWRGTIQDNLAYLFPHCEFDGHYLGLEKFLNEQPKNCKKSAFGPNLNETEQQGLSSLFRILAPIEMLCNSPNGSVTGYSIHDQLARADRNIDADENLIFVQYTRHFQAGVIASIPAIANIVRTHAVTAGELRSMALETWNNIIELPDAEVANAYFQLNHNEQFGLGTFDDKRWRVPTKAWIKALLSSNGLRALISQLETTGWPEGYLARNNLSFLWKNIGRLRKVRRSLIRRINEST